MPSTGCAAGGLTAALGVNGFGLSLAPFGVGASTGLGCVGEDVDEEAVEEAGGGASGW